MNQALTSISKLALTIILLPIVLAVTQAFTAELGDMGGAHRIFLWGVWTYVILNLLLADLGAMYHYGQRIFSDLFRFNPFASRWMPKLLPIWMILFLVIQYLSHLVFSSYQYDMTLTFLAGMGLGLHGVMMAKDLIGEDVMALKPNYLLAMALLYIGLAFVVSMFLDMNFDGFSVKDVYHYTADRSARIYDYIFDRIR